MTRTVALATGGVSVVIAVAILGAAGWYRERTPSIVVATVGTISRNVVAIGRVAPVREVTLANKIPGRIKAVLVVEGEWVAAGQPLIQFDDREYTAQVDMAETKTSSAQADVARARRALETARARWMEVKSGTRSQEIERARADLAQATQRRENAELDRERFKRLVDDGHVARSQYDAAASEAEVARSRVRGAEETLSLLRAGPKPETVAAAWAHVREAEAELKRTESLVAQAQAELQYARTLLTTTVVESTVDGKVTRKIVEPGEAVDIGRPLLILADVSKTLVKAEVDETDVGKLDLGQAAEVTTDAYPGRVFPARVTQIGQAVGKRKVRPDDPVKLQDMKVLETKLEVTEGGADLKLGMTVDVKILATGTQGAVLIPKQLVPAGSREATIQVIGPRGLEPRHVSLGARDEHNVEVSAGLRKGERVAVCAHGALAILGRRRC